MNHQHVFSVLVTLGLSHRDADVYIYLATRGPQEKKKVAETLQLQDNQLNETLDDLENKGIISFKVRRSELVFACPFYQALNVLLEAYMKETNALEWNKEEILQNGKD